MMYEFPCGCKWPIIAADQKVGGLPLMDVDGDNLPECKAVWEMLGKGLTKGVFQLESNLGRTWTKKLKPENEEHLSALGAILRPGAMQAKCEEGISTTQHYVNRKNGLEPIESVNEVYDEVLSKTYGLNIYQENSMALAVVLAGFNGAQSNALRKCVSGDTHFVSKTRGWISIDRLLLEGYKKDLFLIMDENGKKKWKEITDIWETGKKDVVHIETYSGLKVKATKLHQFLTNDGWKARIRLKEGDFLVTCQDVDFDGEDKISSELAIVIAGIITEGYFSERNSTFVNHDLEMMELFIKNAEVVFDFKPTLSKDKKVCYVNKNERIKLNKYIDYCKSDSKCIPEVMMGMTKESNRKFLSFMLAAEGGVSKNGQFEFSSKSEKMIDQVKLLLLRFGISSLKSKKYVKKYNSDYFRLYINDIEDQKKLLKELTCCWPKNKVVKLINVISCKKENNFTKNVIPKNIVKKLGNQYPNLLNYFSGSVYKKDISKRKFLQIIAGTNDKIWEDFSVGSQRYEALKNKNITNKQVKVYDFTIDGEDTPYIIANGIVIHNCIGKKIPEEMAKLEKQFLDGIKSKGIVSEEQGKLIFENIRASQRYSFNHSHAMSYGLLGYDTAYLKAHFPIQFFANWLYYAKEKADPLLEISELIQEAKLMDIEVKTPDIRHLESNFYIDDQCIRFGLTDIKGVGNAAITKLINAVRESEVQYSRKVASWSWEDFLFFVGNNISSAVLTSMISVGAFHWTGKSRNRLKNESSAFYEMTDKESEFAKKYYLENGGSLQSIIESMAKPKKDGGAASNKNRVAKLQSVAAILKNPPSSEKDNIGEIAYGEQRLLGISVSCNKVDAFTMEDVNTTCKEYLSGKTGYMVFGVNIDNVRVFKTKNGKSVGSEMAFLTVSDATCTLSEVVCFPENWKKFRGNLSTGSVVLLEGERDKGGNSLIVKNVCCV